MLVENELLPGPKILSFLTQFGFGFKRIFGAVLTCCLLSELLILEELVIFFPTLFAPPSENLPNELY